MAGLEEKILDGPRIHYCDADDDDKRVDDDNDEQDARATNENDLDQEASSAQNEFRPVRTGTNRIKLEKIGRSETFNGCSMNTGPKGVIQDFKRKVTRTNSAATEESYDIETEFRDLMDDSVLEDFKAKMMKQSIQLPTFGFVIHVQSGDEFLKNIDSENPKVLVISHVFRKFSRTCIALNKCLEELAKEHKCVKFICIDAGVVGLSNNFIENGVPALLAYKGGNLVKSLVSLEEQLDKDFDVQQVKELLTQNKLL